MNQSLKLILFILLPILSVLMYPPSTLIGGLPIIAVAVVAFILLGVALWRGRNWALTLAIFIQGFNVIIRMMMFVSRVVPAPGSINLPFMITSLIAIGLSLWLLLRLDKVDVRRTMVS